MHHQPIRSSLGNYRPRHRRTLLGSLMLAALSLWLTEVATATDYTVSSFDVPFVGAGATGAFGINDSGQIVGYYADPTGIDIHGFVDSGGSFSTVNVPFAGIARIEVNGINNSGVIVGRLG